MKKKTKITTIKRYADKIFSEWIRRINADKDGMVRCCTCGKIFHWTKVDAGHFIPRKRNSTRFNQFNVNCQCKSCNRGSGFIARYAQHIVEYFGIEKLEELAVLEGQTHNWTEEELREIIKDYKQKLEKLK